MKNFEIVIIDDDQQSINKLSSMILSIEKECVIHRFKSLAAYRAAEIRPEALFLDIDLNEEHGFDLYAFDHVDFSVIVISGHTEYAVTGYEYNIFDFLVKPFSLARIKVVMEKLNLYRKTEIKKDKLLVSLTDSYRIVEISGIIKLEADVKYTKIVFDDGSVIMSSNNLGYFENLLNNRVFFRVHNSCIIHISKITKILKGLQLKVVLSDQSVEPVSKRQKAAFLSIFNKV